MLQWILAIVSFLVVKKLSWVNEKYCLLWSLYTINHMLNSRHHAIAKNLGDKTEFNIARFHCMYLENHDHSTAIAILNKSEEIVKNTTAASKYIPRRPRISINWNPPFQTQIYLVNSKKWKISKIFDSLRNFFFALQYLKNWTKVVSWKKNFCYWKKEFC